MKKTLFLSHVLALSIFVSAEATADTGATIIDRPYSYTSSGTAIELGSNFYTNTGSMAITFELSGASFNDIVTTGGTFFTLSLTPSNSSSSKTISVTYGNGFFMITGMGATTFNSNVPFIDVAVPLVFQYDTSTKTFSFSYYYEYDSTVNPYDLTEVIATGSMGTNNPFESENISAGALTITLSQGSATDILTWDGVVTADDIHNFRKHGSIRIDTSIQGETSLDDIVNADSGSSSGTSDYMPGVTKTLEVSGGKLNVDTMIPKDLVISTASGTDGIEVDIKRNNELSENNLEATASNKITIIGEGTYKLDNSNLSLGSGIELSSELVDPNNSTSTHKWAGSVHAGDLNASTKNANVSALGNTSSTVSLGETSDVILDTLNAGSVGTIEVGTAAAGGLNLELKSGESNVNNLTVTRELKLGADTSTAILNVNGSLSTQGITLNSVGSTVSANKLASTTTPLSITLTDNFMRELAGGQTTVLSLIDTTGVVITFNGNVTLNNTEDSEVVRSADEKYIYTYAWETPVVGYSLTPRATTAPSVVTVTAATNSTYVQDKIGAAASSHNGLAGVAILGSAFAELDPQTSAPAGALAGLMNAVDAGTMTDKKLAAAAGASTAMLGQALSGDIERQLNAIRNRSMAGNDTGSVALVNEKSSRMGNAASSRYFAWVNAEGNRAEQAADGTTAGYTLTSWGGTVGAGMQMNDKLTLGLALTAMYGDLQSDGPDSLKGDMDTTYLSAFARYASHKWNHAFIGTVGTMEADYKRSAMGYSNDGDTEGSAFGLMYELSRDYALRNGSSISPVFNIAYRHTEVDGYSESGTDAALNVGKQSLDTMTMGLGARYAAVVGQQTLNRACGFEARALVKYDLGDRQSNTSVGFIAQDARADIESAEKGALGLELGTGISVPAGSGNIFADGAVELRSDYTNFNATVGYRIQF